MTILPKLIYLFSAISIKLPRNFFIELGKNHSKVCLEERKIKNIKGNNEKKCDSLVGLKLYFEAVVIKTICSGKIQKGESMK